jgi:hypothetical protein
MTKKVETTITNFQDNGGIHDLAQYRKGQAMLLNNPYKASRLYHVVFTGSENPEDYQYAINALAEKLRDNNMPCQWKGAYERDCKKRFHFHVFIMVESHYANPCYYIRYAKDGWLVEQLRKYNESHGCKLAFQVAAPKGDIHRTRLGKRKNYATLPKGPKLDNCLEWISYIYKTRSKDDTMKQTYTSSRNRKTKAPVAIKEAA